MCPDTERRSGDLRLDLFLLLLAANAIHLAPAANPARIARLAGSGTRHRKALQQASHSARVEFQHLRQRSAAHLGQEGTADRRPLRPTISAFPSSVAGLRRVDCFPHFSFSARRRAPSPPKP